MAGESLRPFAIHLRRKAFPARRTAVSITIGMAIGWRAAVKCRLAAVFAKFTRFPILIAVLIAIVAVATIESFAPVSTTFIAVVAVEGTLVATILVAILPVTAIIAIAVTVVTLLIVLAMVATIIVTLIAVVGSWLAVKRALLRLRLAATLRLTFQAGLGLSVAAHIFAALFVAELFALHRVLSIKCLRTRQVTVEFTALAHLLFAIGQDDAVIMLGVLQIILCENAVAG